jgi:hypothetical protein
VAHLPQGRREVAKLNQEVGVAPVVGVSLSPRVRGEVSGSGIIVSVLVEVLLVLGEVGRGTG